MFKNISKKMFKNITKICINVNKISIFYIYVEYFIESNIKPISKLQNLVIRKFSKIFIVIYSIKKI